MYFIVFIAIIAIIYVASRAKKLGYFDKKKDAGIVTVLPFPCMIEGSIDAPPMEDRVKALAIEAQSKGITITGNYADDVKAQGGEMMLIGYSFKFTFDATGQIIPADSHANLFGTNYPVQGGMTADGTLGMDIVVDTARVQIQGRVVAGKFSGKAVKSWLPHIYGILNGVYKHV
jgi:hypothetical protein